MIQELLSAYRRLSGNPEAASAWVRPYSAPEDDERHQFILFLKPELTTAGLDVDDEQVLGLILDGLQSRQVEIGAVRLVSGAYLSRHRIMDRHYGVLNTISRQGRPAISQPAETVLREQFKEDFEHDVEVLGGHQFLEQYVDFTPMALIVLSDNVGLTKLAGGTYALRISLLGKVLIVLNPFHPFQLVPFYSEQNTMVALECRATSCWRDLRRKLAGDTYPSNAEPGSIRNLLLEKKNELKLRNVSSSANGIHLSAGPLEGMVEVRRFMSDHDNDRALPWSDTSFGRLLEQRGVPEQRIQYLAGNPPLEDGDQVIPAFDLTEELDAGEAVDILRARCPPGV